MGVFSGMKEAKATAGGNYLKPGNYTLQVQKCKMQASQVGSRKFFIVETKVFASQKTDDKIEANGVDTEPSWLVELPGKYPDLALGNIKAFLHAAYSSMAESAGEDAPDEEDIDEDAADDAISEDNPLVGIFVTAKAFQKETQSGGVFTRVKWGVPDDLKKLVEATEAA